MNAFHVCGGLLALWALLVSFLGITRESFPGSKGAERAVMLISVVLTLLAVGAGVTTAAHEEEEGVEETERGALVLPL